MHPKLNQTHICIATDFSEMYLWTFKNLPVSAEALTKRYLLVLQSGMLLHTAEKQKQNFSVGAKQSLRFYKANREDKLSRPEPLKITSNVLTIFISWAALLFMSGVSFLLEIRVLIKQMRHRICIFSSTLSKKLVYYWRNTRTRVIIIKRWLSI